jgi:hypothetical protein
LVGEWPEGQQLPDGRGQPGPRRARRRRPRHDAVHPTRPAAGVAYGAIDLDWLGSFHAPLGALWQSDRHG